MRIFLSIVAFAICLSACKNEPSPNKTQALQTKKASSAKAHVKPSSHDDWCTEHKVPESQCTRCNPALIPVFKAKGDWCPAHGFPESICPSCNRGGRSAAAPATTEDWCAGHKLPESKCTKCNPTLIKEFKATGDWCAEHEFPESVCPVCNPMKPPATAVDWCAEHGLPESKCTKCNRALIASFKASGDWCAEHGFPESVCPRCNPASPPEGFSVIAPGTRIRFKTPSIAKDAGIQTVSARVASIGVGVECTARIDFNRNRIADVRAPIAGVVQTVRIDLGQKVKAGSALFVLESPRIGDLQGQRRALQQRVAVARSNLKRQQALRKSNISSSRQVDLAKQELEVAEAKLSALESSLRIAGASGNGLGRSTLKAPITGRVVRRDATVGTFATEQISLATIADTRVMWAMLDIREADAASIRIGQQVSLSVDGVKDHNFLGTVTWIAQEVDRRTRKVAARAEVKNEQGLLRANQFAKAVVAVDGPKNAVSVPTASIQRLGQESVVFVQSGPGLYEPRAVKLSRSGQGMTQVIGELLQGEQIVTTGAFLLKTELMKDSIGAGCCEVEAPKER